MACSNAGEVLRQHNDNQQP